MISLVVWMATANAQSELNFESGPVRPLARFADTLFVVNGPDGALEIVDITASGLVPRGSVTVGLDPVAVAVVDEHEVWVVNHLSDSISVVDVDTLSVKRTLLVGDAPRDIVFAAGRAFITTAHRGQHRTDPSIASVPGAGDPQLTTPGVGRADVWVFDVTNPGSALGGLPDAVVTLFGDTPRGLAVSADGQTVYAAVHHSGNRTTVLSEGLVCNGFGSSPCFTPGGIQVPGGVPGPSTNSAGEQAPEVGLIVRYDVGFGAWLDELGRDWSAAVAFDLPDYDVFEIDAATLTEGPRHSGVGTTLFNLAVNPVSGAVYVSNTEAHNEVRFEGSGAFGGSTVQGHLAEARVTVIEGGAVSPHHLNTHIDYDQLPAPAGTSDHSLATPLQMVVSSDGATLYVAAYGSARVGVISTAELASGGFDPTLASADYLVTGGGPSGLVLDEAQQLLYVYSRFDHRLAAIDLNTGATVTDWALPNPESTQVRTGRFFLYDAVVSSSNGEASCASCHIFGDMDHLAWDLGDPDAAVTTGTIPVKLDFFSFGNINGTGDPDDFHPMKGPMTTQTLKGMQFSGALHWRGDRSVGFYGDDPFDSELSFRNFVVAFPGLLGRADRLPDLAMQAFTDFVMATALPPNPVRALDNGLTAGQQAALDFYTSPTRLSDGGPGAGFSCEGCHRLDASAGHYGTDGERSFENETQIIKIPHLRNAYDKVGMFGMAEVDFFTPGENQHQGEQVRGFGFLHDGSADSLLRFFNADVFQSQGPDVGFRSQQERVDMESLMFAFDSDVAPVVGQQVTLDGPAHAERNARVDLLVAAAERAFQSRLLGGSVTECDLVVRAFDGVRVRGFVYDGGMFVPDDGGAVLSQAEVIDLTAAGPVTFTAVLPGAGWRRGVDRDEDGALDGLDPCPTDPLNECLNGDTGDTGLRDTGTMDTDTTDTDVTDTDTTDPTETDTDTQSTNTSDKDGCGCASGTYGTWSLALAALALLRRR